MSPHTSHKRPAGLVLALLALGLTPLLVSLSSSVPPSVDVPVEAPATPAPRCQGCELMDDGKLSATDTVTGTTCKFKVWSEYSSASTQCKGKNALECNDQDDYCNFKWNLYFKSWGSCSSTSFLHMRTSPQGSNVSYSPSDTKVSLQTAHFQNRDCEDYDVYRGSFGVPNVAGTDILPADRIDYDLKPGCTDCVLSSSSGGNQ